MDNSLMRQTGETALDLAARNQIEEQFRLVVEASPSAIILVNSAGKIILVNKQAEVLFGYSRTELLDQPVEILVPPQYRIHHKQYLDSYFDAPDIRSLGAGRDLYGLRKDGSQVPVDIGLNPITTSEGIFVLASVIDVTERNQTEKEIERSHRWLERIAHTTPDIIFVLDIVNNRNVYSNRSILEILGYSSEEFSQFPEILEKAIDPDDLLKAEEFYRNMANAKPGQVRLLTHRTLHKNGSIRWIENRVTPFTWDENGNLKEVIGLARDITERKQAEEQFRLVVEASPSAIILVDTAGKISLVNARTEALFGYGRAELLGQAIEMLVPPQFRIHHLDYRGTFMKAPAARPMGAGRDLYGLRKDGRQVPVEIGLNPITTSSGNFVQASIIDITERKRAEEEIAESLQREQEARVEAEAAQQRMAFLAEASNILASSLDYHTTLTVVAQLAVPRIADWCAVDMVEPDGSLCRVAVTHTDPQKVELAHELLRQYPRDPDAPRGIYHVLRAGKAEFYPEISDVLLEAAGLNEEKLNLVRELGLKSAIAVPILAREQTHGVITFGVAESGRRYSEADLALTEELASRAALAVDNARLYDEAKKLNEQLEQRVIERTAQLEAANKELEAFSYSVSHDLRAPLRSIDGFSQALLEDYADSLDSDGQHYLQRVRAASQRMAQLIDDLLMLSRMTRSEMHLETVNLSSLVRDIAQELHRAEPERDVEFIITPGVIIRADAHLMGVVLENLLGNAWKFTAKRARARIEFGIWSQPGDQTAYFVSDDGAGFDMAYADKLFGAFQRLHTLDEFSGTGIGLATVQRVIHRHGGRVWAEGAVEQGATFYFTL